MPNRRVSVLLAAALMTAPLLTATATSASAGGVVCLATRYGTTFTETVATSPCQGQPRIDRYYAGSVRTYLGAGKSGVSRVTATDGSQSGNYFRGRASSTGTWTGWTRLDR